MKNTEKKFKMSTLHAINSLKKFFHCDTVERLPITRNLVLKCSKFGIEYFIKVFTNNHQNLRMAEREAKYSIQCKEVSIEIIEMKTYGGYIFLISKFENDFVSMLQIIEFGIGIQDDILHEILLNFGKAMNFIHSCAVCHRDIKPGNVMVNIKTGDVKIIDFEFAKNQQEINNDRTISGTYDFVDPHLNDRVRYREEIELKEMIAYDLFACGVTLFQFLTRSQSFSEIDSNDSVNIHHCLKSDMEFPSMKIKLSYNIYPLFSFNIETGRIDYEKYPVLDRKYPSF